MISNSQFRECIVRPSLRAINLYSENAEELLVATMAHESLGGTYLAQQGAQGIVTKGGLGVYQMEKATHDYVVSTLSISRVADVKGACNFFVYPDAEQMVCNLDYATIMARLNYLRFKDALPDAKDMDGIWNYYKIHWNSSLGSATKDSFVLHYKQFIGRK